MERDTEGDKILIRSIYFAARYSRNEEMRGYRDLLMREGFRVTSRWIDLHGGLELTSASVERCNTAPEKCWQFAAHDIEDLEAADLLVAFSGGGGKGGRHVEFGYALARGTRIALIGERENVFYCAPAPRIFHYPTFDSFLLDLTSRTYREISIADFSSAASLSG